MDALEPLAPVSPGYAELPVAEAFTWGDVAPAMPRGEWYMVAFRSVRRADADEALLDAYDTWAHEEARGAPGFVHYFRGPVGTGGACLSFCLWNSRTEARAASRRPAHVRATLVTADTYARYALELHRVRRRRDRRLEFEPWDERREQSRRSPALSRP